MTPQELRNSILQLAVQGKIVEQRSEEGSGDELFEEIQKEKQNLIEQGLIKKSKSLPAITNDEMVFPIPENWAWVHLNDLSTLISDGTHKTPKYVEDGIPFLSVKDISAGVMDFSNTKYITLEEHKRLVERCKPKKGDVLVCRIGTLGKALCIDVDTEFSIFVSLGLIQLVNSDVSAYIEQVINSGYGFSWIQKVKVGGGTHTFKINLNDLRLMPIPLPPLAEQKRIVERIEELMPLVDQYEEAWNRLEELNARFPDDLQKSILQYAIQGKLVPQRSEEGTGEDLYQRVIKEKDRLIGEGRIKKNKPISAINEEELPFEIPNSWKWVKWGNVINVVSARRVHKSDWKTAGIPFYRAREIAQLAEKGFVDNELYITQELYDEFSKSGVPNAGDLMVTAVGTLGKTYVVGNDEKFYYKDASVICLENFAKLYPAYLKHVMQSEMMMNQIRGNSDGTTVATLTMVRMIEYVLPLPPFEEQKRIVERADELFMLCDELKGGS